MKMMKTRGVEKERKFLVLEVMEEKNRRPAWRLSDQKADGRCFDSERGKRKRDRCNTDQHGRHDRSLSLLRVQ